MTQRRRIQRESRSLRWIDARVRSKQERDVPAVISDISSAGCCIESSAKFAVGDVVEIVVPRLGSMSAHIRWRRGRHSGAQFITGSDAWLLPDPELLAMRIAAAMQARSAANA